MSGSIVAGPSAELTWLQVAGRSALRLSLVALLELPRGRFLLLGRAAVTIPVVLDLQLDVMGEIDPAAGLMAVDLAVVSGRMFGLLRVDGTAAMRVRTSDPAAALFTLGGFYPGFRADVPGLPPQRRLSIGTDLPLPLTFRYEGYLALTDGTFQAGARVEVGFDFGDLGARVPAVRRHRSLRPVPRPCPPGRWAWMSGRWASTSPGSTSKV